MGGGRFRGIVVVNDAERVDDVHRLARGAQEREGRGKHGEGEKSFHGKDNVLIVVKDLFQDFVHFVGSRGRLRPGRGRCRDGGGLGLGRGRHGSGLGLG